MGPLGHLYNFSMCQISRAMGVRRLALSPRSNLREIENVTKMN